MPDLLAQNALADARDVAETLGRNFTEADIVQYKEHGIDLMAAAHEYVRQVDPDTKSNFLRSVRGRVVKGNRPLTQAQARVVLNIMREDLDVKEAPEPKPNGDIQCFVCGDTFKTWDELTAHKQEEHGSKDTVQTMPLETGEESVAVIENTTSTMGLDLTNLPDGRYCAPDPSGKNDFVFLMVKRVRRTIERNRRYVYGKITTGHEVVLAGTIEVKIWSSDSKELIGEQKPGDVYRGKYEDELSLIMMAPQVWATLFGKLKGHCCICGKTLTDDISRAIGMGIECERKENYWVKPSYSYVGRDRPDPEKMDRKDVERLARLGITVEAEEPDSGDANLAPKAKDIALDTIELLGNRREVN